MFKAYFLASAFVIKKDKDLKLYRFNNQQINYREKNHISFVQNKIKTMGFARG